MPTDSTVTRTEAAALIPEDDAREIINEVTESSAVMALATRRPNMSRKQQRLPVISTLPTAYFVSGDTGLKQTTDAAWDNVYLNAEELAVIVPLAQSVLDDSDYDIAAELKPYLVEAFGIAIDAAVLFGTNKPSTWPTDVRAAAISAGNNVALGTGADLYEDILGESGVWSKVEADGYMVSGNIAAMTMMGRLRNLRDANGQPIFLPAMQGLSAAVEGSRADTMPPRYQLLGTPLYFPRNGAFDASATYMFSGDFKQIVYAIRQDITYTTADQGVIQDAAGNIVYNLFQNDMVAIRAVMRLAVAVPNPPNRLQSTAASRYPIGVLTT